MLGFGSIASTAIADIPRYGRSTPMPPEPVIQLDKGGRYPQAHNTNLGPTLGWLLTDEPLEVELVLDGGGPVIDDGVYGCLVVPEWLVVRSWMMFAGNIGAIEVDVWRLPLTTVLTGVYPSAANSITGTDTPFLFNERSRRSAALTGWNTFLSQNDVLVFNVKTIFGIFKATIVLQCLKVKLQ